MTFHRASGPILKQPRIISAAIRKSAQGQAVTFTAAYGADQDWRVIQ